MRQTQTALKRPSERSRYHRRSFFTENQNVRRFGCTPVNTGPDGIFCNNIKRKPAGSDQFRLPPVLCLIIFLNIYCSEFLPENGLLLFENIQCHFFLKLGAPLLDSFIGKFVLTILVNCQTNKVIIVNQSLV